MPCFETMITQNTLSAVIKKILIFKAPTTKGPKKISVYLSFPR